MNEQFVKFREGTFRVPGDDSVTPVRGRSSCQFGPDYTPSCGNLLLSYLPKNYMLFFLDPERKLISRSETLCASP